MFPEGQDNADDPSSLKGCPFRVASAALGLGLCEFPQSIAPAVSLDGLLQTVSVVCFYTITIC